MTKLWELDKKALLAHMRNVQRLESYQGTSEALGGDERRLIKAKLALLRHFGETIAYQLSLDVPAWEQEAQ